MEKLKNKSSLLPLYKTVHEILISYEFSFNCFEVIGSFSLFKDLLSFFKKKRNFNDLEQ